jgi:quercetin dioxygenase-like cupin family protein
MNTIKTVMSFSLMAVLAACAGTGGSATAGGTDTYIDPTEVSPDVYKTLHEDDNVRIVEMTLAKGMSDKTHSHPYEAVYFIKGGKGQITLPDGKQMEKEIPDGGVMAHEGWTHTVKNIGDTDIHAILVELKKTHETAGAVASELDPTAVAPTVYKTLLDNDRVRIVEMTLAKGAEDGKHAHPFEAVYFIKGGKGQITLPDGKQMEKEIPDGGVMAHPGWEHTVKNIGETDIHAIIVEVKS